MLAQFAVSLLVGAVAVRAGVTPDEPSPGSVFNEGSTCHISWKKDTASPDAWKSMTITLRTGSNLDMKTITTVATNQDGTQDGVYDYPCPDVTPNSAIYFYEFDSPATTDVFWTTRFTIADASGASTPPQNANQPNGDAIPWGIGALANGAAASGSSAPVSGSSAPAVSSALASGSASSVGGAASTPTPVAGNTSSMVKVPSTAGQTQAAAASASGSGSSTPNGAVGTSVPENRFWMATIVLGTFAAAFTLL